MNSYYFKCSFEVKDNYNDKVYKLNNYKEAKRLGAIASISEIASIASDIFSSYEFELSEDITDNYKSYGFAYILFHSKYFDWKKDKFNLKFVELIEPIFGIQIIERKGKYYPKDGLKKTKEILNIKKYKKLYGLLDDETKRRLKDKS